MTPPLPLDQIRLFDWKSHRAALWWLGVLYRRPKLLEQPLAAMTRGRATVQGIMLYLHCLPYLFLVLILLRAAVFSLTHEQWTWPDVIVGISGGIAVGIAVGIVFGIAFGIVGGIAFGIVLGIAVGIASGIAGVLAGGIVGLIAGLVAIGIAVGIAVGVVSGIGVGVAFVVGSGIGVGIVFGIAGGIAGAIAGGIAGGTAAGIAVLRAYYFVAHPLLVWPQARGGMYPYHPVAWDDLCSVPFPGLDRLLVAFAELHPQAGAAEVERIISSYPIQRTQALRARMILLARETKQLSTLVGLEEIAARLPQGHTALLDQSSQIAEGLHEIAMLQTRINTTERPLLRAPQAELLLKEIENFRHRIAGFKEPLASEFRGAASVWSKMAQKQLEGVRGVLGRKPAEQVFRAGDPVQREQEAFVYRDAVAGRLDQQITLASGCPGIVLYARRRMGKSTFLTNLDGFLPSSVLIRSVSMQDANVVASLKHLVERISEGHAGDLVGLSIYLTHEDQRLGNEGRRLLLTIDEYEGIDAKIGEGVFPKDLLATVRESIQQHRRIIWLFAGSHEITELTHAEWPSYLISARTIEIPLFCLDETRLLLTDPLKHSPLYRKTDDRLRFAPELWGPGGIERIHEEAGGWPHLLQLIAETVVDLLNSQGAPLVTLALMEKALDEAVISGQNVLFQLMRRECSVPGEWEYLSAFRETEQQNAPADEAVRRSLLRRQLILDSGGRWRLRVPLMARWLRLRG